VDKRSDLRVAGRISTDSSQRGHRGGEIGCVRDFAHDSWDRKVCSSKFNDLQDHRRWHSSC
jgi:hypothetical protein